MKVSASPPGIERPVTELRRRAATVCHHKTPGLRSADNNALLVPRTSLKFGERAISVAGPAAWNSLPTDIGTNGSTPAFKKKLKTFLFLKFYDIAVHSDFIFYILFHFIFVNGLGSCCNPLLPLTLY